MAALAVTAVASPSHAVTTWQYVDTYDERGVPSTLVDLSAKLPSSLLGDIRKRLPERLDIQENDPKLIIDDPGANVVLLEDAEITVVFLDEGAGYRNSVGFFTYDPGNKPKTPGELKTKILFPNFSLPPQGAMRYGDGVKLGKFKAGSAVGFTIVGDGWNGKAVNPNQSANAIFTSLKDLNPEKPTAAVPNLNAHTVLLSKPEDGLLLLRVEDMNRSAEGESDNDFNDVVIAIQVTPFSAVDRSKVQALVKEEVVDSDDDDIPDVLDAFPQDPKQAGRRFYPSATGFGSLAFEDLWPKKGDFDMNDLVVAYRAVETLNAKNEIVDLKLMYEIRARGAGSDNGFGLHLAGLSRDAIDAATLSINNKAAVALPMEAGQTEAVFILSPNVTTLTNTGQPFPCSMMNTVVKCARTAAVPMELNIHFKQPVTAAQLGAAPFNPFIYRTTQRGLEVHLVDHPPTAKANLKLFGTLDDTSNPAQGRYYRTGANEPWALDVPETWRYPTEWNNVARTYPNLATWAASGGQVANDWYVSKLVEALAFPQ